VWYTYRLQERCPHTVVKASVSQFISVQSSRVVSAGDDTPCDAAEGAGDDAADDALDDAPEDAGEDVTGDVVRNAAGSARGEAMGKVM
jgi:hypothetical protein